MNCIVTLFDRNCVGYAPYALQSFRAFSHINGFELVYFDKLFLHGMEPPWHKLYAIKECFDRGYEWVFWADVDSIFIASEPLMFDKQHTLVMNTDYWGICTSHFVIQNNYYNKGLLDTLLFLGDVKDESKFGEGRKWEQNTLKALLMHFNIKIKPFPANFVSEPKFNRTESNTQFLHFAITSHDERNVLMPAYYSHYYNENPDKL